MRKDYVYSGGITLVWFIGLYALLWIIPEHIVAYWSILVLAIFFVVLGFILPEKKGS